MYSTPLTPVSHLLPQSGCRVTGIEASGAARWEERATATRMKRTGAKRRIIGSVTHLVGMALGIVAHHQRAARIVLGPY